MNPSGAPVRRFGAGHGVVLALSVAVVTAVAVLLAQFVAVVPGDRAYAAAGIPATGPMLPPGENPLYAIQEVLEKQSAALLRGDRAGYLRAIPATQGELRAQATARFTTLTALRVRKWTMTTIGIPGRVDDIWKLSVDISYCFDRDDCAPLDARVETRWAVPDGRLQLVAYEGSDRPWDDGTALVVKDGARVTVASADADPAILDRVLRAAEAAAVTNDRFATTLGGAPQRYHVYVAGDEEWLEWYGGASENAAAFTIPLAPGVSDVVVDHGTVTSDGWATTLLTHEFAHVVSLGGENPPYSAWWLTEGIAEYIANTDGSVLEDDLRSVRRYLAASKWDGTVTLGPPPSGTSLADANARYGIAFLTVQYLADRFGEERMLAFFTQVVRRDVAVDAASRSVFGTAWSPVAKDAASSIRAAAQA
ncbi:hypothetical protein KZZ52_23795 [Dactylosporangium sp. AC04546]|uniref:hypothetical protein n=1 Tax=Dactylosporangium sp. AC04546 TaxID=2862460 RepID=UPI001EDEB7EB|nr:hypothetical protein [Dactylosporangium sp. AC04546]WVK88301.1 hypothetical protein KZZ52_23795 [Dactylosporangium sp. AC04546]